MIFLSNPRCIVSTLSYSHMVYTCLHACLPFCCPTSFIHVMGDSITRNGLMTRIWSVAIKLLVIAVVSAIHTQDNDLPSQTLSLITSNVLITQWSHCRMRLGLSWRGRFLVVGRFIWGHKRHVGRWEPQQALVATRETMWADQTPHTSQLFATALIIMPSSPLLLLSNIARNCRLQH